MLIGIVGLIGSGKDTVAERLVKKHGFVKDSFAKSLKGKKMNKKILSEFIELVA